MKRKTALLLCTLILLLGAAFSGSRSAGCLACLLGTFSFLSLDMSLFIRMYELANLAVLLLFCAHLPWLLPQPAGLGAGAFFLAAMTHYYCLLFALALWLWTSLRCLGARL